MFVINEKPFLVCFVLAPASKHFTSHEKSIMYISNKSLILTVFINYVDKIAASHGLINRSV